MEEVLQHSKTELERAKQSLELMKNSNNFKDFENNWRDFLNFLEKSRLKAEKEGKQFNALFENWNNKYFDQLKKDDLLKYLWQARHSDNHSIQEIVDKIPGYIAIGAKVKSKPLFIESMTITGDGKGFAIDYKGSEPLTVEVKQPKIEVLSIKNRGVVFNPPASHLGNKINNPKNPIEIASLGIKYYEKYIHAIESKFFQK